MLKFYREAPELLAPILNKYMRFGRGRDDYLIRTYTENPLCPDTYKDGERYGRAFLSRQYKRIDNLPMLDVVSKFVEDTGLDVNSVYIDEYGDRMSIKASPPDIRPVEVCPGDLYKVGFNFANSEQGNGCVSVAPFLYRVVCSNGLVVQEKMTAFTRIHKGFVLAPTYMLKKADAIEYVLKEQVLEHLNTLTDENSQVMQTIIDGINTSKESRATLDAERLFLNLSKNYSLSEKEMEGMRNSYLEEGDYTKHGVIQAFTWYASHEESLPEERVTGLQSIAGSLLYISPSIWTRLNKAA